MKGVVPASRRRGWLGTGPGNRQDGYGRKTIAALEQAVGIKKAALASAQARGWAWTALATNIRGFLRPGMGGPLWPIMPNLRLKIPNSPSAHRWLPSGGLDRRRYAHVKKRLVTCLKKRAVGHRVASPDRRLSTIVVNIDQTTYKCNFFCVIIPRFLANGTPLAGKDPLVGPQPRSATRNIMPGQLRHVMRPPRSIVVPGSRNSQTSIERDEVETRPTADPVLGGYRKRILDIVLALAAIIVLMPLICMTALIVKLTSDGSVFYKHKRIGRNGVTFDCIKFRSMAPDGDDILRRHLASDPEAAREWEATHKLKNDPRVTPFGSILRKSSLDELPQLINVLKGEMSLVGPRPVVNAEVRKYGTNINYYLRARPGMTGLWQVSGRNDVDYDTRVALDRKYVEEWSLGRDLIIMLKTACILFDRQGSY
jgi:exopolysaccharide production protein ExoY